MKDELQLSPEEIQLLQVARRLGLVNELLEKTRQAEIAKQKKEAEGQATTLAYRAYQAATKVIEGTNASIIITITVPYGDGERVTAVYPPKERARSVTHAAGERVTSADEIDHLIQQLREAGVYDQARAAVIREMTDRGGRWQGMKVALRTAWARELARQHLPTE